MAEDLRFDPVDLPPAAEALRAEVRAFLATHLAARPSRDRAESWSGFDAEFSRELGRRGLIGMTWPKAYGGGERSPLERFVVLEELLAAGAPVAAHWIADRQSGPLLLKFGTEAQRQAFLPRIARGELFMCIGMSEPDSGSDLAGVRTRAVRTGDGWRINGRKLWTSNAHQCHGMILFCRTGARQGEDRHGGFSQFLVDLDTPGITVRPVYNIAGEHHFNEIQFDDALVPEDRLVGQEGQGWKQVMAELAFERSGPERFLSSFALLVELARALGPTPDARGAIVFGRVVAHIAALRRMSISVAGMLAAGRSPDVEASLVKDLGTALEQEIPELSRQVIEVAPSLQASDPFAATLARTMFYAPSFTLRGGTREILRGIIARGLGLR